MPGWLWIHVEKAGGAGRIEVLSRGLGRAIGVVL